MEVNIPAFLSFALVTTFTPGPNNVSCASMGVLFGYRRTLRYIVGILAGFFFMMMLSATVAATLLAAVPALETVMRVLGAGYILWLAYKTLRTSYAFKEEDQTPLGFKNGLLLQLLNPKGIVYGLTLFSTFLAPITGNPILLIFSGFLLTTFAFGATSVWTLFGAAIREYLHRLWIRRLVNLVLSLLLVYTAVELLRAGISF